MKSWRLTGLIAVACGLLLGYAAAAGKLSSLLGGEEGKPATPDKAPRSLHEQEGAAAAALDRGALPIRTRASRASPIGPSPVPSRTFRAR